MSTIMPIHFALKDKALEVYPATSAKIYFKKVGHVLVVACDPIASEMCDKVEAWFEFCRFARLQKLKVCGYYFSRQFANQIRQEFRVFQAGVCRSLNFNEFSLSGKFSREIRRGINYKNANKWWVQKIDEHEKNTFFREIKAFEKHWINSKGPFKIYFLLSRIQERESSTWYALRDKKNNLISFVSLYKLQGNFYVDQMIQGVGSPKMALNALISDIIVKLLTSGVENLSFGFNAFIGLPKTTFFERILSLGGGVPAFYNAKGIYKFKKKYTNCEESRFLIIQKDLNFFRALLSLCVVTFNPYTQSKFKL